VSCDAVIFDMDGTLIDSEPEWERARLAVVATYGGTYHDDVARDVMGMCPPEWSRYLHERVAVPLSPAAIEREVVSRLVAAYTTAAPFIDGALAAVRAIAARWPIAIASSSGRDLIDLFVKVAGLSDVLAVTVSAAEVGRGKPAPDVYLRAAELLRVDPARCVAVEDSSNGIRAAYNAGMRVVAIPDPAFPVAADALAQADLVLDRIAELTPARIDRLVSSGG
jgi:HAD superfamily hydrolase (TIGR01509 family)